MPKTYSLILSTLLFACAGLSAGSALAETALPKPSVTTASYENWVLRCVNLEAPAEDTKSDEHCEVVHAIQIQGQQQPVAQIAIGRLPNDVEPTLTVVVPHNVAFSSDVAIAAGREGEAAKNEISSLKWKRCLPQGCFADSKINVKKLTSLQDLSDGSIRFRDGMDRGVELPVSWKGLSAALAALK